MSRRRETYQDSKLLDSKHLFLANHYRNNYDTSPSYISTAQIEILELPQL